MPSTTPRSRARERVRAHGRQMNGFARRIQQAASRSTAARKDSGVQAREIAGVLGDVKGVKRRSRLGSGKIARERSSISVYQIDTGGARGTQEVYDRGPTCASGSSIVERYRTGASSSLGPDPGGQLGAHACRRQVRLHEGYKFSTTPRGGTPSAITAHRGPGANHPRARSHIDTSTVVRVCGGWCRSWAASRPRRIAERSTAGGQDHGHLNALMIPSRYDRPIGEVRTTPTAADFIAYTSSCAPAHSAAIAMLRVRGERVLKIRSRRASEGHSPALFGLTEDSNPPHARARSARSSLRAIGHPRSMRSACASFVTLRVSAAQGLPELL